MQGLNNRSNKHSSSSLSRNPKPRGATKSNLKQTPQYNKYNINYTRGSVVGEAQPRRLYSTVARGSLYEPLEPKVVADGYTPASLKVDRSGFADQNDQSQ